MLSYKNDGDNYTEDSPDTIPILRFIHARKEVLQRLIVKACWIKNVNDLKLF
jgi:hypothetical protein